MILYAIIVTNGTNKASSSRYESFCFITYIERIDFADFILNPPSKSTEMSFYETTKRETRRRDEHV